MPNLHESMWCQLNHTSLFQGIAKAPRTTLSSLYLDNNSKKERTGFYIGNVYRLMYVLIVLSRVIITSQSIRFVCYLCSWMNSSSIKLVHNHYNSLQSRCIFDKPLFRRYLTRELIWHNQTFKDGIVAIWERASISLLMLSAKQGNYWYRCWRLWFDLVLYRGLNPGPPALDASTLPLVD